MILTAFRIVRTEFLDSAFDGEGARLNGGRWNSVGTSMVYTASSLSLATLELMVHLEDLTTLHRFYRVIPIQFDEELAQAIDTSILPSKWNESGMNATTQILGDRWIDSRSSALLAVPSAVTLGESNFLINPAHPDFKKIVIGKPFDLRLDPRLKGKSK